MPEPDASSEEISPAPRLGELGVHDFCRDIATHLARLLNGPATELVYRENPWHRRDCPRAWFLTVRIAGHTIAVTGYETPHPLDYVSHTSYALTLDDQAVPFERMPAESLSRQITRTLWIAHQDQQPPGTTSQ